MGVQKAKFKFFYEEIKKSKITFPSIYIGDSKYDHQCALENNIDFLFVSKWTEFKEWKKYCKINSIPTTKTLSDLI